MHLKRMKKQFFWLFRFTLALGPPAALTLIGAPDYVVLSFFCLGFFLFLWPRSCRAINVDGTFCRGRAYGFLGGCYILNHKWQNAWRFLPVDRRPATARPDLVIVRGRQVMASNHGMPPPSASAGMWGSPGQAVATLGSLGSLAAAVIALLAWLFPTV